MKKFMYLKKEDKERFLILACATKSLEGVISNFEKYRKEEKPLIKNAKMGRTYIDKVLTEMLEATDPNIGKDLQKFVDANQVIIAGKNDVALVQRRKEAESNQVSVDAPLFVDVTRQILKDVCMNCEGKPECSYRTVFLLTNSVKTDKTNYEICPFCKGERNEL